jgi:hypothetical protein
MGRYIAPTRPADGFRLSRRFGDTSACFVFNGRRICPPHTGQDYSRRVRGGALVAQHAGKLVYKGGVGDKTAEHPKGMGGYGVIVDFGGGYRQLAAHLVWDSCPLAIGADVEPGTYLGEIDSTGTSSGDHLHNELLKDGRPVDPAPYLAAGRLPIDLPEEDTVKYTGWVEHVVNRKTTVKGDETNLRAQPTTKSDSLGQYDAGRSVVPHERYRGADGKDWYACTMPDLADPAERVFGFFREDVLNELEPIEAIESTRLGLAATHLADMDEAINDIQAAAARADKAKAAAQQALTG